MPFHRLPRASKRRMTDSNAKTPFLSRLDGTWQDRSILLAAAIVLLCVTLFGQPSTHYFFDAVGIRDAGTVLYGLNLADGSWLDAIKETVYRSLAHIEGPLQFLLLNLYYAIAGQFSPLSPAMAALPNVAFGLIALYCALRLGGELFQRGEAIAIGLILLSQPWLFQVARMPWFFNTMTSALEFAIILVLARFMLRPDRLWVRIALPALGALYLLGSLSWPAFGAFLVFWVVLSGKLRSVLSNPFLVLPGLVIVVWGLQIGRMVHYGNLEGLRYILPTYPFLKTAGILTLDLNRFVDLALSGIGVAGVFAVAGALTSLAGRNRRNSDGTDRDRLRATLLPACGFWLLITLVPLVLSGSSYSYSFVSAVPVAILGGWMVTRLARPLMMAVLAISMAWSFYVFSTQARIIAPGDDDRRVPALAAYLNVKRPDLLDEDKTAFLPRNLPANVGQYTRGRNARIFMSVDFIWRGRKTARGSPEEVLRAFITTFREKRQVNADWLVLVPEYMEHPKPEVVTFFKEMSSAPGIAWTVRFRDKRGREIWLGEKRSQGTPLAEAPVYSVEDWADIYWKKFDNIHFLSRNLDRVSHY